MKRNAYLNEKIMYAEDSQGYVYLTVPESPLMEGFVRKVSETAADHEKLWAKLDAQEKRNYEQMNEADFNRRADRMKAMRSELNGRMSATDCTNAEKDFIRESLKILDRKESMLYRNSVYGVAAMQATEAPLKKAN